MSQSPSVSILGDSFLGQVASNKIDPHAFSLYIPIPCSDAQFGFLDLEK